MKRTLSEIHPELAREWSEKNDPLSPDQITYGSNKRVWWRGICGHEWEAPVKARSQGENCPYCAGKRVLIGFNDLATTAPDLAREWSEKNEGLSPKDLTAGSHQKVWWKGLCGHEWQAVIKNRVQGAGCPYCSGQQVLAGENDLATVRPELTKEWSERNRPLRPKDRAPFSNQQVWWICQTCGGEWKARIADRASGSRCPYCSGRRFQAGCNDLATTHPELAAEWSGKNDPLTASQVNSFSRQSVWWTCRTCGSEWKAGIRRRVQGSGCPVCAGRLVREGINDLQTTDPVLCEEWDVQRNDGLLPSMVHRSSREVVWWNGGCGHIWRQSVADRVFHGKGCPQCERDFQQILPYLMILYYAWRQGVQVLTGESRIIGLPLDFYFPECQGAIVLPQSVRSQEEKQLEEVKDYLCRRRKIRLIRIWRKGERKSDSCDGICLRDERVPSWGKAIQQSFHLLGIHTEIRPEQDQKVFKECYRRWKAQQAIRS